MIDFEKFEQQFGMDKDDFLMFLEEFEQRLVDDLPVLKSMLQSQDYVELSLATHKLKAPAATLGLIQINQLLAAIESNAKSEPALELLNEKMRQLEHQFGLFRSEFAHFKSENI